MYSCFEKRKRLIFLAEADDNELHKTGFDATYTWTEFHIMNDIAAGKKDVSSLDSAFTKIDTSFMKGAWRLYFTSNHDENSWNKADYATMPGLVHAPFALLALTYNRTLPLIYSGQEEPVLRPLAFFEKDSIEFKKYERAPFYKTILDLRNTNAAFKEGAIFTRLKVNNPKQVIAYQRKNGAASIVVVLNLSDKPQQVELPASFTGKNYLDIFTKANSSDISSLQLPPWGYKMFAESKK
ncbi:MAG: alpha-glucosidase C-terminal domain-containing protein [Sediminibacterium sp.]